MLPPDPAAAQLAHVGVAVRSLEEALAFYRDVLGFAALPPQSADGATAVMLVAGATTVELLSSRDPATPIGRFLERHGPGIHHLAFRVGDLDGALARCRALGYRLVDEGPRPGADGRRVAFLHPKATSGILVELTD